MFEEMKLNEFIDKVASSDPVPGGGSVSAMAGSTAAALSAMVAGLTIGKKKYAEVEEEIKEIKIKADELKNKLLKDIEKDSEAFNLVMKAFGMPKTTDEEKAKRKEAIQTSMKKAAEVPFDVAKSCFEVMKLAEVVVEKGNKNAVTDGAVSAMLARTAILGALYNVKINLDSIKDEDFVEKYSKEVKKLEEKTRELEEIILSKVGF